MPRYLTNDQPSRSTGRAAAQHVGSSGVALSSVPPFQKRRDTNGPAIASQSSGKVIQPFFGFEMELPVLLSQEDMGRITEPDGTNLFDVGNFEVHKDHMTNDVLKDQLNHRFPNTMHGAIDKLKFQQEAGIPIVELANKKMDERTLSETDVEGQMQAMATYANGIFANTNGLRNKAVLNGNLYVGADGATGTAERSGNTQATYGVRLSAVPEAFNWHGAPKQNEDLSAKVLTDAVTHAETAIDALKLNGLSNADAPQLKGLIALIIAYLLAGKERVGSGTLLKNNLGGAFYKSRLDKLRNQLGTVGGAGKYIADNADLIRRQILAVAGRGEGDRVILVFQTFTLTCKDWVDEVLAGTDDTIAKAAIDSKKLGPDTLGPATDEETGVVMENRRLDLIYDPNKRPQWYNTSEWARLGKAVYHQIRALNKVR